MRIFVNLLEEGNANPEQREKILVQKFVGMKMIDSLGLQRFVTYLLIKLLINCKYCIVCI